MFFSQLACHWSCKLLGKVAAAFVQLHGDASSAHGQAQSDIFCALSGKTTAINMLIGLMEPTSGKDPLIYFLPIAAAALHETSVLLLQCRLPFS